MVWLLLDVQRTILASPRGIVNKEEFFELWKTGTRCNFDTWAQEILWELLIPPEYFLTLFQKDLDNDTFTVEKYPYRRRKNLLVIYRGLQFLLEHKFEILISINIVKKYHFSNIESDRHVRISSRYYKRYDDVLN